MGMHVHVYSKIVTVLMYCIMLGINSICCYDICDSGVPDIILGRADGIVEIFSMDENNQPRIQFTHVSITCTVHALTTVHVLPVK